MKYFHVFRVETLHNYVVSQMAIVAVVNNASHVSNAPQQEEGRDCRSGGSK